MSSVRRHFHRLRILVFHYRIQGCRVPRQRARTEQIVVCWNNQRWILACSGSHLLDSSVLITAERQGQNARQTLAAISGKAGNTDIAVSVVTLIELAHGAARGDTSQRKEKRQQFIQELLTALPIHPVTLSVALLVGQIDGENQARGTRVPLPDLLIGVTALELGYSVGTANLRHFQQLPGLSIVEL